MRVVFMGSPDFALPTLRALYQSDHDLVGVFTQPDRPAGRGRSLRRAPAAEFAADHGLALLQPANVNTDESLRELRGLEPEVLVVAAYGQILKQALLDIPAKGSLNVHASLLPRHRGAAPSVGALLAGDSETGVTIQEVVLALDAGPIVAQRKTTIDAGDTTGSLNARLSEMGADLLLEVLPAWGRGEIEAKAQDEAEATYTPTVKRADAVIDWTMSAVDVWRRVRAYMPWPVATTSLDGSLLRILEAWPVDRDGVGEPGTVIALPYAAAAPDEAGFAVACGQGALAIVRAQRAGKRPMSGAELLRGYQGLMGRRLS
jgi:methionyl-tRNA formyltransferase